MFGTYRTILALAVAIFHLLEVPNIGPYAVHGFFVLSGYLMTAITIETYPFTPKGIGAFATNRLLRLWPLNFAVLAITAGSVVLVGQDISSKYHPGMFLPGDVSKWLQNLTMIYPSATPFDDYPLLIPASWALTFELFYYAVIALGASRTPAIACAWFVASICITFYLALTSGAATHYSLDMIYLHLASASLPFSIGAMLYHTRSSVPALNLRARTAQITLAALLFSFILLAAINFPRRGSSALALTAFYANIILHTAMIALLARLHVPKVLFRWDTALGRFSYPIYLTHFTVGLLVSHYIFGLPAPERSMKASFAFVISLTLMVGLSYVLIRIVDDAANNARDMIKRRLASQPRRTGVTIAGASVDAAPRDGI